MKYLKFLTIAAVLAVLAACGEMVVPEGELKVLDNVKTDVVSSGAGSYAIGGSTQVKYYLQNTGAGGVSSCDVSTTSPAVIRITPASGVLVNNGSFADLTFTSCGSETSNTQTVTFSGGAVGSYAIGHSLRSGPTTINPNPADFTLGVTAASTPADTTAPVVSLTTPANGSATNDNTPNFSGVAGILTGDAATVTVKIYSGSGASGTPVQALSASVNATTGDYSIDAVTLGDGTYTAQAEQSDAAGNRGTSTANTFMVDTVKPTINIANVTQYTLNQPVNASFSCADTASGIASCVGATVANGDPIDTGSVGPKSFTVNARDNAGNTHSVTHNYTVTYNFGGFQSPLNALPTRNMVKAGRAIPVKFSLGGDQGLDIFAVANTTTGAKGPKSGSITCTTAGTDPVEETLTSGSSSLSYDTATDQYTYVWKTDSTWATKCRNFELNLKDGSTHKVEFTFTK